MVINLACFKFDQPSIRASAQRQHSLKVWTNSSVQKGLESSEVRHFKDFGTKDKSILGLRCRPLNDWLEFDPLIAGREYDQRKNRTKRVSVSSLKRAFSLSADRFRIGSSYPINRFCLGLTFVCRSLIWMEHKAQGNRFFWASKGMSRQFYRNRL